MCYYEYVKNGKIHKAVLPQTWYQIPHEVNRTDDKSALSVQSLHQTLSVCCILCGESHREPDYQVHRGFSCTVRKVRKDIMITLIRRILHKRNRTTTMADEAAYYKSLAAYYK